jgi:hypothetical protein
VLWRFRPNATSNRSRHPVGIPRSRGTNHMNSPTIAIAWEIWSRNRWATTTLAVALPVLAFVNSSWLGEWFRMVEVLLLFFSITTLFWTFCCIEPDARNRQGGFPARMFTLPLPTLRLIVVPTIGGALTLAIVYWLWTKLIFTVWGVDVPASTLRTHLLTLTALLFSLQAIVWSLYRFPWIRLALILVSLIGIGLLGFAGPGKAFRNMSETAVLGTLGVITAIAFVAAVAGVSRDRCGEWDGWTQRLIERLLAFLPRRRKPFSSRGDAQVWFEWRGKALFLSSVLGLPMLFGFMLFPLPTMLHADGVTSASIYANLPLLILVMAWCLGMTVAKTDYWTRESELSSFVTARPLTDGDIVIAKLKTAALVIATASIFFLVLAIPAFNTLHWFTDPDLKVPSWSQFKSQNPKLLLHLTHPLVLVTAFAATWATMGEGLAIGLRGQKSLVLQSVVRVTLFLAALICVGVIANRPGGLKLIVATLPWASATLITWKLVTTILWFNRARAFYSSRQRLCLAALWSFVVVCLIATAALVWTEVSTFDRAIVFAAAFLAPGSAVFRAAASLHRNRHQ